MKVLLAGAIADAGRRRERRRVSSRRPRRLHQLPACLRRRRRARLNTGRSESLLKGLISTTSNS
jgi:hypothetical protein